MKVYIITEGGSNFGLGHVARCTSLYQAFEEKKINPYFIINGDPTLTTILSDKNYYILDWFKEPKKLFEQIRGADIVIIDSYLIDRLLAQKISKSIKLAIFIDDTMRIKYPKGVVINSAIHAKMLPYPKKQNVKYLLGAEYSMLKKEFWDSQKKIINDEIEVLMLTLGGNDIANLSPKILKILQTEYPHIKKKVIVGKNFQNIKDIENICNESSQLIYFPNSQSMKEMMLESDIAITAGGQTVYELASIGLPAITISVIDHQIPHIKACAEFGLNFYAGWWQDKAIFDNIRFFLNELRSIEIRTKMIQMCRKFVKADGSRDIIAFLIELMNKK